MKKQFTVGTLAELLGREEQTVRRAADTLDPPVDRIGNNVRLITADRLPEICAELNRREIKKRKPRTDDRSADERRAAECDDRAAGNSR